MIGTCDHVTGECLKCAKNTKNGYLKKCELCADGYFGNPVTGNCSGNNDVILLIYNSLSFVLVQ